MLINEVVTIKWMDITHFEDDYSLDDALRLEPETMTTYGVLLANDDDKDKVIIASTKAGSDEFRCVTVILKCLVISITKLQEVK